MTTAKEPSWFDQARMLRCLINNLQDLTANENAYNDRPCTGAESASFEECIQWLSCLEAWVSRCLSAHRRSYAADIEGIHRAGGLASLTASSYGTQEFHRDEDVNTFVKNLKQIADTVEIGGPA